MTTQFLDLVRQQITNSGTGDLNLGAAVSGWLTVALAGGVDGSTYSYGIIDPGNTVTQTECGTCVWHSGTNSITRTPSHSTNGNAAINASAQAHIIFGVTAEDMNLLYSTMFWQGARVGTKIFPMTSNVNTAPVRTANLVSLQAANDYAVANKIQEIELSWGQFYIDPGFYLDPPGNLRAPGQFQFTGQPTAGQVLSIFGTFVTYVASGATGLQVNIGANLAATLTNTLAVLNASSDINLTKFTYGVVGNNLNVTAIGTTPAVLGTTVTGCTTLGAANPTTGQFSLKLRGQGQTNNNGYGSQLLYTDNSQWCVIIGTGQGMGVTGVSVISTVTPTSRIALPGQGIGFALNGNQAGISRSHLEDCGVWGLRKGYVTGANADQLCDSTTLIKCSAFNCYIGAHVKQTQNYINSLINCDFGGNTRQVLSDVAKPVNIYGGNYSTAGAFHNAFTIGSVTSLVYITDPTQTGYFNNDNATFTVHISAPDQAMVDGAYDAFVINTVAFGPIPLLLVNYNAGTQVATFKFYAGWLYAHGMQTNLLNGGALATTFNTALSGATTLYACETITVFEGFCFNVDGVHVENPDTYTRFFFQNSGFGGDYASRFNRITFNWNISGVNDHGGSAAFEAIFQCQQAFPFINMIAGSNSGTIELTNIRNVGGLGTDRVNFDAFTASLTLQKRVMSKNCDINWNLRVPGPTFGSGPMATSYGFGDWDPPTFQPQNDVFYTQPNQFGAVPYKGYFPAPAATPAIDSATLASLQGASLPGLGTYPPIMGRTPYRVYFPDAGVTPSCPSAARFIESNHTYWSYGQNLTMNWSYVAGSPFVAVSDFRYIFNGLRVILNNGTVNDSYVVTGIFPTLGYMAVTRWRPGTGIADTAGTAGSTQTGTSVGQEAFSWFGIPSLLRFNFTSNANAGAQTAAQGDMTGSMNTILTLSAIGANTYTTRTAAQLFADIPGCYPGFEYFVDIKNTSAGITTLGGGAGVTISGTATMAVNTVTRWAVQVTSAAAVTMTRVANWSL